MLTLFKRKNLFEDKPGVPKTDDKLGNEQTNIEPGAEETGIKPEIKETDIEPKVEDKITPEKIDPLEGLSLEEKNNVLTQKKAEVEELKESRRDYYVEAKGFEEKMTSLGLSDEQKKKINEQIKSEGGEISDKINKIKEEYGFKPTAVEIYSERLKLLTAEKQRIESNLDLDNKLAQYLEDHELSREATGDVRSRLLRRMKGKFGDIPVVSDFFKQNNDIDSIDDDTFRGFIQELKKFAQKTAVYKTPGEHNDAERRFYRLGYLVGETEEELDKAQKKEGRFRELPAESI